jgi:hypothetical protein
MHQLNGKQYKTKAALGLLMTIFVAAACSHKNIKDEAAETDLPAAAPVFATEPDATTSEFEQVKNEPAPEPLANPIEQQQKKSSKHKISKKSSSKKHLAHRRHKKSKKIVKNHKRDLKKTELSGTAAGSISQLPPPPPSAPIEQLTPPPPPPMMGNNDAQISQVNNDSTGYQWLYIGTAFALVLGAIGYRYRGRLVSKKSRSLIFNS